MKNAARAYVVLCAAWVGVCISHGMYAAAVPPVIMAVVVLIRSLD